MAGSRIASKGGVKRGTSGAGTDVIQQSARRWAVG